MENEIWKDVFGYEGLYKVSNIGNVKQVSTGKILKQTINIYPMVGLRKDGRYKQKRVHRLVAIAFIPNPENKPEVNHLNGNKNDYSISNLEWCTAKENIRHAFKTGLMGGERAKGADHGNSTPIICYDLNGNFIREFGGISEAARYFNKPNGNLCSTLKGRRKTWCKLKWTYKTKEAA